MTAIESERPDAITLDLEMPDMTGPKFNRALEKSGRDIPIVVITGHPGLKYVIPGARAVFDKPIDRLALLAALRDILGPPEAEKDGNHWISPKAQFTVGNNRKSR